MLYKILLSLLIGCTLPLQARTHRNKNRSQSCPLQSKKTSNRTPYAHYTAQSVQQNIARMAFAHTLKGRKGLRIVNALPSHVCRTLKICSNRPYIQKSSRKKIV